MSKKSETLDGRSRSALEWSAISEVARLSKFSRSFVVGCGVVLLLGNLPSAHAETTVESSQSESAESDSPVNTVRLVGKHSSLTIALDEATPWGSVARELPAAWNAPDASLRGRVAVVPNEADYVRTTGEASTRMLRPEPTAEQIYCDRSYSFRDDRGTFSVQRKCDRKRAPWGYRIASALQPTVVGSLRQRGMWYTVNGGALRKDYAHVAPPNYTFHGFFRAKRKDRVSYADRISWRHNIGPGGNARLRHSGVLKFRGG